MSQDIRYFEGREKVKIKQCLGSIGGAVINDPVTLYFRVEALEDVPKMNKKAGQTFLAFAINLWRKPRLNANQPSRSEK